MLRMYASIAVGNALIHVPQITNGMYSAVKQRHIE